MALLASARQRQHSHVTSALGIAARVLVILLVVVAVAGAGLAWRLSSGPLTLNILSGAVRNWVAEALGPEADVNLEAIVLAWTAEDGPGVRLRELDIRDPGSGFEGSFPAIDVGLNTAELFLGRLSPRSIRVYSPQVRVPVAGGSSTAPDTLLEFVDHAIKGTGRSTGAIGLSEIKVEDATIELQSQDADGHHRLFSNIAADLTFAHDAHQTTLTATGIGYGGAWSANLSHGPEPGTNGSVLTFSGTDISIGDLLGTNAGVATTSLLRIPVYPQFEAHYDEVGRLTDARLRTAVGAGYIDLGGGEAQLLDEARLAVRWVPKQRALRIEPSVVEFGGTVLNLSGLVLPPGSSGSDRWSFGIDSVGSVVASHYVEGPPAKVDRAVIGGTFDPDSRLVDVEMLNVFLGEQVLNATVAVDLGAFGPKITAGGAIKDLPVDMMKRLWPSFLAPPARRWVMENVEGGGVITGNFRAEIGSAELDDDPETYGWGDDELEVSFEASDIQVKTFGNLPSLRAKAASGRIRGGAFTLDVPTAEMQVGQGGSIDVHHGRFAIADIRPPLQTATVRYDMAGATRHIAAVIDAEPIGAIRKIGLVPSALEGTSKVAVEASFPLLKELPFDDIDWSLKADLTDFGSREKIAGRTVSDATLAISATPRAAVIKGKAKFDGALASVDVVEPLDGSGKAGKVGLQLRLTDADRKKQGLDFGNLISGPVDVTIDTDDSGMERYEVDLREARLNLPIVDWSKKAGTPAIALFAIDQDDRSLIRNLKIESKDLDIAGTVSLDKSGGLVSATFTRFKAGSNEFRQLKVSKPKSGDITVVASAKSFDARQMIEQATSSGKDDEDGGRTMTIEAQADRLIGFNAAALTNVSLKMRVVDGKTNAFSLNGVSGKRDPVEVRLTPSGNQRDLTVVSQNAGDFFRFLNLYKRMQGGAVELTATLLGDSKAAGRMVINDFRVSDDQALKQLVKRGNFESRTSDSRPLNMRPIAETGDAVFQKLRVNFALNGDKLTIGDALLRGTTIGGSAKGSIDFSRKRIAITGTMLPAYGVNNLFGRIPLLGGALGGGRDGGLIGVTFKVAGPVGDPEMAVNPLSAVAPGIFRRVFEFN